MNKNAFNILVKNNKDKYVILRPKSNIDIELYLGRLLCVPRLKDGCEMKLFGEIELDFHYVIMKEYPHNYNFNKDEIICTFRSSSFKNEFNKLNSLEQIEIIKRYKKAQ
jgi:hypothetical protein